MRAGHRKAAKGNDGVRTRASDRTRTGLSMSLSDFLGFRRGLCGAGLEDDIVTAWDEGCGSQCCFLLVMLADGDGHFGALAAVRASPDWVTAVELQGA